MLEISKLDIVLPSVSSSQLRQGWGSFVYEEPNKIVRQFRQEWRS